MVGGTKYSRLVSASRSRGANGRVDRLVRRCDVGRRTSRFFFQVFPGRGEMERPRQRTSLMREKFAKFRACGSVDPPPDDPELLQDIIAAFLNRMKRVNESEVRRLFVYVQRSAAHQSESTNRPTLVGLGSGLENQRYWDTRRDLLTDIVCGSLTKATHSATTVLDRQSMVDAFLYQHKDYRACRNVVTRVEWLKQRR